MIVIRRRLIFWLVKAYLKQWGRTIFIYFGIGLLFFFILRALLGLVESYPFEKKEVIGMVGAYTINDLPSAILSKISYGLTQAQDDGTVKPALASKWKIINDGKVYVFYLKRDVRFSDGSRVTSDNVDYGFTDVDIDRPNQDTIVFKLKDNYAPFLITVSQPIFKKGFVGVGKYKIKNIKLNGNFVESLELISRADHETLVYQFYPTTASLKSAFILGEVSRMEGLLDIDYKDTTFAAFKNTKVVKAVNYRQLVTLFYNTRDGTVSSKSLREGLAFTIPDQFDQGLRNPTSISPRSFASENSLIAYHQDLEHAKLLLEKVPSATAGAKLSLTLDTLARFEPVANQIAKIWRSLGLEIKVEVVDTIPQNFQIFLGEFTVSLDPDQYVLWHSQQTTNITRYVNLRIDKLLEDGRKEIDIEARKKIYAEFQKFLFADPPAAFLFLPYYYEVSTK